jgi:hypothetical protein
MAKQIRQWLGQLGITLEDRAGGIGWRRGYRQAWRVNDGLRSPVAGARGLSFMLFVA